MNYRKMKDCENCLTRVSAQLVRNITSSGVSQIFWLCPFCNCSVSKKSQFIPHEEIKKDGINIDDIPVKNNYSGSALCAVCGSPYAELHHWAPRYLFPDDSGLWPQSYLCRMHHEQWHRIVTPNMTDTRI